MKGVCQTIPHPTRPMIDNPPRNSIRRGERWAQIFDSEQARRELGLGPSNAFRWQSFADDSSRNFKANSCWLWQPWFYLRLFETTALLG